MTTSHPPLRAILFDLWETLINDGPERSLPRQARRAEEVKRALDAHGLELDIEPITSALNASMRALTQLHDSGVDVDSIGRAKLFQRQLESETQTKVPEESLHHLEEAIVVMPEEHVPALAPHAVETLDAIKALGLRTVLVSNAGFTTAPALRWMLDYYALRPHLDVLVFSDELQLAKPEPKIFVHALEAIGEAASVCAFVGDSPHNDVYGAQQAGILAVQIGRKQRDGITPDLRIDTLAELVPGLVKMGRLQPVEPPTSVDPARVH
jgi:HAD superfamily hydrolase (TIGR01509 family)